MRTVWRWLLRGILALAAAAALAALVVFLMVRGSLPDYEGERRVVGAEAPIEIVRDEHGVPHIQADSRADAFFGLGFVHAQDRLWQMHLARRAIPGRLSEIFGRLALSTDLRRRAIGYAERAEAAWVRMSAENRALLEAYARGVEAGRTAEGRRRPPEALLLGVDIEPWTARDSVFVLFSFWPTLAGNWRDEVEQLLVAAAAGEGVARALDRPFPEGGHVSLALEDLVRTMGPGIRAESEAPAVETTAGDARGHSNNWVLGSTRSASGAPLLANDPHLGLTTPSIWYLAHLSYPGHDQVGATVAGMPGVVIGHGTHVAWGLTTVHADTDDLFVERLAPDDPGRYATEDGYAEFETRQERFQVRFVGEVTRTLKRTRHGPVIPREIWDPEERTEGFELALASTVHRFEDRTLRCFLDLAHARTGKEVFAAARFCGTPPQNMVFASDRGEIGYVMIGPVPDRGPDHPSQGRRPAPGEDPRSAWRGLLPFERQPRVLNPASGVVVTANGRTVPSDFAPVVTPSWPDPGRAARIQALVDARPTHDLDSTTEIQLDVGSTKVPPMLRIMLQTEPWSPRDERALDLLRSWDGRYTRDAPQPALYHAFQQALTDRIMADEMGWAFPQARGRRPEIVRDAFGGSLAAWCDDRGTTETERCADLLAPSLAAAVEGLSEHHGADPTGWAWGDLLVVRHTHLGLGPFPGVGDLFNTYTPREGGPSSPNVSYPRTKALPRIEARAHGPSLRFVVDMADVAGARFQITTGQSGHVASPHYADRQAGWTAGEYIQIPPRLPKQGRRLTLLP